MNRDDVVGDVDRIRAFEGDIDALVADHADILAAGDDRLNGVVAAR